MGLMTGPLSIAESRRAVKEPRDMQRSRGDGARRCVRPVRARGFGVKPEPSVGTSTRIERPAGWESERSLTMMERLGLAYPAVWSMESSSISARCALKNVI